MLDPKLSLRRQSRLLQHIQQQKLDAVVVGLTHHVYYFSAHFPFWQHQIGFVLFSDGKSVLISANAPADGAAADECLVYQASWDGTQRQDMPADIADLIVERLRRAGVRRVGFDASPVSSQVLHRMEVETHVIDPILWQMRRVKDADELALMQVGVLACEAMYARAKEIIEPGVEELHVFAALHEAAVNVTGEPMTAYLGNDYACGVGGGKPRKGRTAQAGELYILDLGPTYRGYFSDNCRAFSVDRKPTDVQLKAQKDIASCFPIVESMAKPGVKCRDIYHAVDQHLKLQRGSGMVHHLGHGVGLQPHEYSAPEPEMGRHLARR
jgi:Xaa-Pro aminopeptidase